MLEHYLEGIDRGWIYRHAYTYRGARQAEDEEQAGYRFLTQSLSDTAWVQPPLFSGHPVDRGDAPRASRQRRQEGPQPGPVDRGAGPALPADPLENPLGARGRGCWRWSRAFWQKKAAGDATRELLLQLTKLLEQEKAGRGMAARLPAFQKQFAESPVSPYVEQFAVALQAGDPNKSFPAGAELSFQIRRVVEGSDKGRYNLELLDFNALVQELGFETSPKLTATTRRERLAHADGSRALRRRGGPAFDARIRGFAGGSEKLQAAKTVAPAVYYDAVRYLGRTAEWCRATAAKDFGPVDAALRAGRAAGRRRWSIICCAGSIALRALLAYGGAQRRCAPRRRHPPFGFRRHLGQRRFGAEPRRGDRPAAHHSARPRKPRATSTRRGFMSFRRQFRISSRWPGVLTLDSGNMLSHTQLLAANLGIPNARIPSIAAAAAASPTRARRSFFAVTPRGRGDPAREGRR